MLREQIPKEDNLAKEKERWEKDPDGWAEEWVKEFEKLAAQLQANAANVCLEALERVKITSNQKQRLLTACEQAIHANPENSKERRQLKEFGEYKIPSLEEKE